MVEVSCESVAPLVRQGEGGLPEDERAALSRHLGRCLGCRDRVQAMRLVATAIDLPAQRTMAPSRRERVVAQALAEAFAAPPSETPQTGHDRVHLQPAFRLALLGGTAGILLLVATGIGLRILPRRHDGPGFRAASDIHLIVGEISIGGRPQGPDTAVPADTPVSSSLGAELSFGRATVRLAPGSRISVDGKLDAFHLAAGSVSVLVAARIATAPFRVVTTRFVVEVIGTQFDVGDAYVAVQHGVVGVVDPKGAPLATVRAGERWSMVPGPTSKEPDPPVRSAPVPARMNALRARAVPGEIPPADNGVPVLAEARRALAAGRVAEARLLVDRAFAAASRRTDRAEAETLRAECALVAGEVALAGQLYLLVAQRYPDLPAGENALFAAATVARKAGQAAGAIGLLKTYARRYPDGRFGAEVRASLEAAPPSAADGR